VSYDERYMIKTMRKVRCDPQETTASSSFRMSLAADSSACDFKLPGVHTANGGAVDWAHLLKPSRVRPFALSFRRALMHACWGSMTYSLSKSGYLHQVHEILDA